MTQDQTDDLLKDLEALPNVKSIQYLSKQDALKEYAKQNAGNQSLIIAANLSGNPIPATVRIKPVDLNKLEEIKTYLSKGEIKKLQTKGSPSYSGDRKKAIDNITHATNVLRKVGIAAVGVFAIISALIIFNTIQMAIFNRRDEIPIERLLELAGVYPRPVRRREHPVRIYRLIISLLLINCGIHGRQLSAAG